MSYLSIEFGLCFILFFLFTLEPLMSQLKSASILDSRILVPAIGASFTKLNPRTLAKNPVMFVVAVVSMLTTVLFLRDLITGGGNLGFSLQINIWLWFTVLFANFAEAVAEGRGKAQADSLRKSRTETGEAGQAQHQRKPLWPIAQSTGGDANRTE